MDPLLSEFKQNLQKTASILKEDLKTVRTGGANPVIVEQLMVETYGGQTTLKLMELASIITDGPTALVIQPFDPSVTQDIERAILKSPLGLTPQVQGTRITIRMPALSEEQREKYVKLVGQKTEEKKNVVRNLRDDIRKEIKILFDNKDLSEDQKFRLEKEIDTMTQKANEELITIKESKEKDIREI